MLFEASIAAILYLNVLLVLVVVRFDFTSAVRVNISFGALAVCFFVIRLLAGCAVSVSSASLSTKIALYVCPTASILKSSGKDSKNGLNIFLLVSAVAFFNSGPHLGTASTVPRNVLSSEKVAFPPFDHRNSLAGSTKG